MAVPPRSAISVWAQAFHWEKAERLLNQQRILNIVVPSGVMCSLCYGVVPFSLKEEHVAFHRQELIAWMNG